MTTRAWIAAFAALPCVPKRRETFAIKAKRNELECARLRAVMGSAA